jgi:RNA polymerase sigma factor (sigma-70 family)
MKGVDRKDLSVVVGVQSIARDAAAAVQAEPLTLQAVWQKAMKSARRNTVNRHEAQDVASVARDVVATQMERDPEFARDARRIRALIAATVRNRFKDLWEQQRVHGEAEPLVTQHMEITAWLGVGRQSIADLVEFRDAIERAMAYLPPDQRDVCTLFYLRDRSQAAIAEVLGKSVRTVEKLVEQGTARLRIRLKDYAPRAPKTTKTSLSTDENTV